MLEPGSTPAFNGKVAQEHAHGGKDHADGIAPVVPKPLLDENPETAGPVRPWVIPKIMDELTNIECVRAQGCLDNTPVDSHPLDELLDQRNGLRSGLDALDDSVLPEVLEEPADTREDLSSTIPRRSRAHTARAMSLKCTERLVANRPQPVILVLDPDAEVGDRVKMEPHNDPAVTCSQESVLVLIKKTSQDWRPDRRQTQNRLGVIDMH